jgi:hypothetical protein
MELEPSWYERLQRCAELNVALRFDDDPKIAEEIIAEADQGLAELDFAADAVVLKTFKAHRANALTSLISGRGARNKYWLHEALADCDDALALSDAETEILDGVLHKLKATAFILLADWPDEDRAQCLSDALVEYQLAVWAIDRERMLDEWSHAQHGLAEVCYQLIFVEDTDSRRLAQRGLDAITAALAGWHEADDQIGCAKAEAVRGNLYTWLADADGSARQDHLHGAAEAYLNAMQASEAVGDFDLYGPVGALYGETCWALAHEPGEQPVRALKRALQGLSESSRAVSADDRPDSWVAIRIMAAQVLIELAEHLPKRASEFWGEAFRSAWAAWSATAYRGCTNSASAQAARDLLSNLRDNIGEVFGIFWEESDFGARPEWL